MKKINVTIWNEYPHGQDDPLHRQAYPKGLHTTIKDFLEKDSNLSVRTALFDDEDFGLSEDVLNSTDVLIWWAHVLHHKIPDELVKKIKERALCGMGVILLHSAHYSKLFSALLGTSGRLLWREANEKERIWTICPSHPIAEGIPETFTLEAEEMYGERFDIPTPDDIVFMSWFAGGNVLRSGVTFTRGAGKIFYFQPGHETHPTYFDKNIQRIITNAVNWAAPKMYVDNLTAPNDMPPKEEINYGK